MIESRHSGVFKRFLAERRQKLLEELWVYALTGTNVQITAGKIAGLDEALGLSDAADDEINGG